MEAPTNQRPYRVCDSCGRLTPTTTPWCVECGVASKEALEIELERQDEQRFAAAFFSRNVWMTWAFLAANVGVFVFMVLWAGTLKESTHEFQDAFIRFGARVGFFIDQGEYWRFVTPMFVHTGVLHLLINMYSLWIVGSQVERLYGASRFVVIYLLSGLSGSVASYFLLESKVIPSAGASTALSGLVGVLLVFALRYRSELPGVFRHAFSIGPILFTIFLNIVFGAADPRINNIGHLGGFVGGILIALVVPYARRERRAPAFWVAAATLLSLVVCASFVMVALNPRTDPTAPFVEAFNGANRALARGTDALAEDDESARIARDEVVAASRIARSTSGFDSTSTELLQRTAGALDGLAVLLGEVTDRRQSAREPLLLEIGRLQDDWSAWFALNGEKHGLTYDAKERAPGGPDAVPASPGM